MTRVLCNVLTCYILTVGMVACGNDICVHNLCMGGAENVLYVDISLVVCRDECRARHWCTGVSYHVPSRVCKLHGSSVAQKHTKECTGFCYSDKATWKEQSIQCEDPRCNSNRSTCTSGDICLYNDCPVPIQSNGILRLLGNLRVTGATIAFTCTGSYVLHGTNYLTCRIDGTWSDSFPSCSPVSSSPTTVTSVSSAISSSASTTLPLNSASTPTSPASTEPSSTKPTATPITTSNTTPSTAPTSQSTPSTTTTSPSQTAMLSMLATATTSTTFTITSTPTTPTPQSATSPTPTPHPTSTMTKSSSTPSTSTEVPASTSVSKQVTASHTKISKLVSTESNTITTTTMVKTTNTNLRCLPGWVHNQQSCYFVGNEYKTYVDAVFVFCPSMSAQLATPNTSEENEFIKGVLSDLYNYWVGIGYNLSIWLIVGSTGSPTSLPYNDWHDGIEPASPLTLCAIYSNEYQHKWMAKNCFGQYLVVCEMPAFA